MHLDPKAEFTQIFNEGWRLQRDYLVRAEHARRELAAHEGNVWRHAAARRASRRPQLPARQHGRGDRDRPLVRARRRDAGSAGESGRPARRRLRDRGRPLQDREDLRRRELEPRSARAARRARHQRHRRRLHPRDRRRQPRRARQHLSIARRHRESADRADPEHASRHAGRAAGDRGAGRQRSEPAHARVGRREPPLRREAIERPARLRLRAEHRARAASTASIATTSRSRTSRAR